jgi:FkbM family methyltransferase
MKAESREPVQMRPKEAGVFVRLVRSVSTHAPVLGLRGWLQWLLYRIRTRFQVFPPRVVKIHPRSLLHPVEIRAGASSDRNVFVQVVLGAEYSPLNSVEPLFILDLGANIGLSSAWFLSRFTRATVLAVEPDPGNYAMCCKNVSRYGQRARVLLGAVWSRRTKLALCRGSFRDGREWATQVRDRLPYATDIQVDSWDVGSLIELSNATGIDLLKVDIERAELEVFSNGHNQWLPLVRNICIELHDTDCEEVFFAALTNYEYDLSHSGELTICRNLRPRQLTTENAKIGGGVQLV